MDESFFDPGLMGMPADILLRQVFLSGALERATWHPLGFIHTELVRNDEFALRFHIWPPFERKSKSPNWQVHNHVFLLTSRVLVGTVENKAYRVVDAEREAATKQVYEVAYGDGYSELLPTQRYVAVECDSVDSYPPGSIYHVPRGAFHESYVEIADVVATLVRTDFQSAATPLVIGDIDQQTGRRYEYQRMAVNQADLRIWFEMAERLAVQDNAG